MRLDTYLRIKQAAGPRYAADATPEELADWTSNELKGRQALEQLPGLQSELDDAIAKNNKYYFDNARNEANWQSQLTKAQNRGDALSRDYGVLQQIHQKNVDDLASTRKQLDERNQYVKDLEDIYNEDTAKYTALQNHTKDKDPLSYVKELEKEYSRADARGAGRGNTIRRQAEELAALNNRFSTAQENARRALAVKDEQIANQASMLADNETAMGRMRRNAAIGGAVGGGVIGGGLGYGLANWGGKKLGLKGNKALALNIAGTAAGAGLGGYGGYRLGQMI